MIIDFFVSLISYYGGNKRGEVNFNSDPQINSLCGSISSVLKPGDYCLEIENNRIQTIKVFCYDRGLFHDISEHNLSLSCMELLAYKIYKMEESNKKRWSHLSQEIVDKYLKKAKQELDRFKMDELKSLFDFELEEGEFV